MNAVVEATPIAQTAAATHAVSVITPAQMLQIAVERNATIEQMERLYALKREFEADEARKALAAAFARFKAEAVQVVKTKAINDGPLKGKKHADLWDVVTASSDVLARFGLSTSWAVTRDEPAWIEVTCTLKHEAGHSESVSLGGEPDTGPGRNKIQARGSTITYLQRYTLMAILGLAAREQDDDGNGGGEGNGRSEAGAQAPSFYDQAAFDANLGQWRVVIKSGRKTADNLIAFIESRGKPLTEAQKQALRSTKID